MERCPILTVPSGKGMTKPLPLPAVSTSLVPRVAQGYVATLQLVMGSVVLHAAIEQRQASPASVLTSLPGTEGTGFATLLTRPQIETGMPLLLAGLEARREQHHSAQD